MAIKYWRKIQTNTHRDPLSLSLSLFLSLKTWGLYCSLQEKLHETSFCATICLLWSEKWQPWVQQSPRLPVNTWKGLCHSPIAMCKVPNHSLCLPLCESLTRFPWIHSQCFLKYDQASTKTFFQIGADGHEACDDIIMPTMTPKRPRALPKISITNIFTNRVEFCASDNAQLLPMMPTQSLPRRWFW